MKTIQYIAMNHPGTFRPHNQDSLVIPQAVLEERRTEPDSKPVVLQGELPLDDGLLFGVLMDWAVWSRERELQTSPPEPHWKWHRMAGLQTVCSSSFWKPINGLSGLWKVRI